LLNLNAVKRKMFKEILTIIATIFHKLSISFFNLLKFIVTISRYDIYFKARQISVKLSAYRVTDFNITIAAYRIRPDSRMTARRTFIHIFTLGVSRRYLHGSCVKKTLIMTLITNNVTPFFEVRRGCQEIDVAESRRDKNPRYLSGGLPSAVSDTM